MSCELDSDKEDVILVDKKEKSDNTEDGSKKSDKNDPNSGFLFYLIDKHMWIFAIWLIPISLCYDIYWWFQVRWNYLMCKSNANRLHDEKVQDVQKQVEDWKVSGCKQPMCTARPGWQSITLQQQHYKKRMYGIKIDMPDILEINEDKRIVTVEPMVTIGKLNDFLVGQGWTLPVVPELDDLTIGGLVMGGGIESTSHKYGLFQYICKRFEMVLGDGRKIDCTATQNTALFAAIPFSYGTLGFLTCIDIDIIPYKPYIELTYHNVKTLDEVVDKFTKATNNPEIDSVEGHMYTLNTGVIMSGKFLDKVPSGGKLNTLSRWYKPWFYKHVEKYMDENVQKNGNIEYIPTEDFFHRQNKSFFWLLEKIIPFANNVVFRYLLGWTMPPKFSMIKLMRQKLIPQEQNVNFVLQDFGFKLQDLKGALEIIHKEAEVYPIWLCPSRHIIPPGLEEFSIFKKEDCHVDIGVYGYSPVKGYDPIESQRRLERYAIDHQGYAAPYAETQLTREEFSEMFGVAQQKYQKLREELDCEKAFPHVYEKISKLGRS